MANSAQENLFGVAAQKSDSSFGTFGNLGQSPNAFSNAPEQSGPVSSFSTISGSPSQNKPLAQSSTSVFGAVASGGFGTHSFSGLSNKPSSTFGSVPNVFGGQPLFGSSKTASSGTQIFGNKSATSASGKTLFGAVGSGFPQSSSSAGSEHTFGSKPTPALFGGTNIIQSNNPFASSSTAVTSSNVFGTSKPLFTGAGAEGASRSSLVPSLRVDDSDGSFRKRSSSGTMGSSVLFGKKQAARTAASASTAMAPFPGPSGGQLFKTSSQDSSTKPAGDRKLFGKDAPSAVISENQNVFSAKLPSYSETVQLGANSSKPGFPPASLSEQEMADTPPPAATTLTTGPSPVHEVPPFGSASSELFGKPASDSSGSRPVGISSTSGGNVFASAIAFPSSSQVFGKVDPPPKVLFGKDSEKTERVLFGKVQPGPSATSQSSGTELFSGGAQFESETGEDTRQGTERLQEDKASSPSRRSLSKWNRNRETFSGFDKKRTGEEEEDTRETKRARGNNNQAGTKVSPPLMLSRSRLSSARQSVDDANLKTSIIVKDIPVHLNKGQILREHFARFGEMKRLQPMPTKNAANITFKTHAEAKAAKDKGKHLGEGPPLSIFWRNVSVKSPGSVATASMMKSPEIRPRQDKSRSTFEQKGHVQDELASMAGTFDHREEIYPDPPSAQIERSGSQKPLSPSKHLPQTRTSDRRSPSPSRKKEEEEAETQAVPDIDIAKKLLKTMRNARPRDATEVVSVLDARDKFLRMLQRRQSNLASATAFIGTCEDMCAEKERYYREDIRRLALYEVIPSTMTSVTGLKSKVDHARAVKEYSRSSADQEEPLPHELRPLRVLMITMNYLLSEVADQGGEGKWSEWYDFLWNRTRGIRKDITQQQLCEVEVAELLEKCTRFHIFCSARLCEEDMMSFDSKINNENLTKCLQTIKELYADLDKRMIYCPNEAEFRAYMVLMNLNEGDTLREVQQLRLEIRESTHIKFALKAYHALNSSNYVRFFRLIKEATFLNACALHRYFNQIRGQALRIIMKAHRATGKNRVMYPVRELMRLLRFEDAAQVESFCDHYCLTVEGDEIVMDAQAFLEPETSIHETRSPTLVEAKRTVSVGEIINGCPLPPLHLPTPSSSFDSTGTFILPMALQDAVSKGVIGVKTGPGLQSQVPRVEERQLVKETSPFSAREGLPNAAEVQRGRAMYSNEAIKSIVRSLIIDELDKEMQDIAKETFAEEIHHLSNAMGEVEDIASAAVQDLSREVAEEVIEEEEASFRQKLAEEMAAQRLRVFTALCDGIIEDTVTELATVEADNEMMLVNQELHHQRLERCSLDIRDDTLAVAVETMILDVAQEVFEVDVLAKRERLAATEACVLGLRCRRFFQMWQRKYLAQIRVKRAMLDFPSTAPNRSLTEQMQSLMPHRPNSRLQQKSFFINERAKLTVQTPMEVIQQQLYLSTQLSMASARSMLAGLVLWRALDLSHTVVPQLYKAFAEWIKEGLIEPDIALLQWKLCVSLPKKELSTTEMESNFCKWVRAKLCKDSNREALLSTTPSFEGEELSLYHLNGEGRQSRQIPLGICIRAFHGKWTDDQELTAVNKDFLKGMSALVFVCSTAEDLRESDSSVKTSAWNKDRLRLHQMFKQKPKYPMVPLVLIVPRLTGNSHLSIEELKTGLQLLELRRAGLLSTVHVAQIYIGAQDHPIEFFSDWTSQLSNCLRFAAMHAPAPPKLWAKPVSSYVEDMVIELYKAPVYQDLRTRTRLQLLHQSPNTLVSLYNEVIEHIAIVCASDSVGLMSWPAPEFDKSTAAKKGLSPTSKWNTDAHLCDLYELVIKMRLPSFRYNDMESQDWSTACRDVWSFLNTVTKKDSGSAKIALFQQTATLLVQTKKSFDRFCWLALEDGPCEPTYTNMVWTDLIDACIQYKLLCLRSGHMDIRKPDDDDDEKQALKAEDFEEVVVYYREDELNDFEAPASWIDALRDTETSEHGQLKPTVELAAAKRDQTLLEESLAQSKTCTKQAEAKSAQMEDTDDSWALLQCRFDQERTASERFQSLLVAAVSPTAEPLIPPHQFEAHFSPILATSDAVSASQSGRGKPFPPLSAPSPPDHRKSLMHHATDTPRRPLAKSDTDNLSVLKNSRSKHKSDLGDGKTRGANDSSSFTSQLYDDGLWAESSLSEKVISVRERVAAQKQEDLLFEMKLRRMMDSSPLLL